MRVVTAAFNLVIVCNAASAITGLVAAFYWWQSSRIEYPRELRGIAPIGGAVQVNANPLLKAAQECGRLNGIAALWSALTAFLVALSAGFGAFSAY